MISTKKLTSMARKWQRLARASRRRISLSSRIDRGSPRMEKGCFVVYTTDSIRFVLPLAFLQSEIVKELLKMAEEEFGLVSRGPITLPCDSICLKYAISMIQRRVNRETEEAAIFCLSSCRQSSSSSSSLYLKNEQLAISCC